MVEGVYDFEITISNVEGQELTDIVSVTLVFDPILSCEASLVRTPALVRLPLSECRALYSFFQSTGGPEWGPDPFAYNWFTSIEINDWSGPGIDLEFGRDSEEPLVGHITSIIVGGRTSQPVLNGPLPPEIGDLTELRVFQSQGDAARFNGGSLDNTPAAGIRGPIPPEIGKLTNLERLVFFDSYNLVSEIPTELGDLESLFRFDSRNAELTGELPRGLANLQNVDEINIFGTSLSGIHPEALNGLPGLRIFNFEGVEPRSADLLTTAIVPYSYLEAANSGGLLNFNLLGISLARGLSDSELLDFRENGGDISRTSSDGITRVVRVLPAPLLRYSLPDAVIIPREATIDEELTFVTTHTFEVVGTEGAVPGAVVTLLLENAEGTVIASSRVRVSADGSWNEVFTVDNDTGPDTTEFYRLSVAQEVTRNPEFNTSVTVILPAEEVLTFRVQQTPRRFTQAEAIEFHQLFFSTSESFVTEGIGELELGLTIPYRANDHQLLVTFTDVNAKNGEDYTPGRITRLRPPASITDDANINDQVITVDILDDNITESSLNPERFNVAAFQVIEEGTGRRYELLARSVVNITDNDSVTIGFLTTEHNTSELNPFRPQIGVIEGELAPTAEPIVLSFSTEPGTATEDDYFIEDDAIITPERPVVNASIRITNDVEIERESETFTVEIVEEEIVDPRVRLETRTITVNIAPSDIAINVREPFCDYDTTAVVGVPWTLDLNDCFEYAVPGAELTYEAYPYPSDGGEVLFSASRRF